MNRNIDGFAADITFAVPVFIGMTERFHLTVGECVITHLACVHRVAALRACGGYNGINIAANRAGTFCVTAFGARCGNVFFDKAVFKRGDVVTCKRAAM